MTAVPLSPITWDDFMKVDLRIGTVVSAEVFAEARKPAYKMQIDFGSGIGIKKSSAQITAHYTPEELVGKQVLCVVNFPPKQIGPLMSEALTTGVEDVDGHIVLVTLDPKAPVPNGKRLL